MQQSSRRAPTWIGARLGLVLLCVAGLVTIAVPAQAVTSLTAFTLESETGDPIGGQSFTFTSSNATITATREDTAPPMTTNDRAHSLSPPPAAPPRGALATGSTHNTAE